MFCRNCGKELDGDQKFCPHCGAAHQADAPQPEVVIPPQADAPQPEVVTPTPQSAPPAAPTPPAPPAGGTPSGGPIDKNALELVLKIMSGVLAVLFGIAALRGIFGLVGFIFDGIFNQYFLFIGVPGVIFMLVLRLVSLAAPIVMCLTLVLAVAKWSPAMNDLIFVGACLATVIRLLALLVNLVGSLLHVFSPVTLSSVGYFFGYVAVAGVLFLVFYLMGCAPIMGKDLDGVKASVSKGFSVLSSAAEKFKSEHPPKTAQNQTNGTASPNPSYATAGTQGRPAYAGQAKKTSRGLIKYILLSFITCGIYPLVLVHMLSSDMNEICEGDGNKTGGLLAFLLLGMITCGIYQFVWWYKLCNRMAANAPRYGITFQENGTTYLMWSLFGMLLCGIGPFIALHFVLRNSNALCNAYNQQNGLSGFAN